MGLPVNYVGWRKNMKECSTISTSIVFYVDKVGFFRVGKEGVTQIKFTL